MKNIQPENREKKIRRQKSSLVEELLVYYFKHRPDTSSTDHIESEVHIV